MSQKYHHHNKIEVNIEIDCYCYFQVEYYQRNIFGDAWRLETWIFLNWIYIFTGYTQVGARLHPAPSTPLSWKVWAAVQIGGHHWFAQAKPSPLTSLF